MKVLASLLTFSTLFSLIIGSHSHVDQDGFCQLSDADFDNLESILENDENPKEKITEILAGCRLEPSDRVSDFLLAVLRLQNDDIFEWIADLSQMTIEDRADIIFLHSLIKRDSERFKSVLKIFSPEVRNQKSTEYLFDAINNDDMEARDFLLVQDFKISGDLFYLSSFHEENLDKIKQLISSHPERIAELCPTNDQFSYLMRADEGLLMIELIRHCAEFTKHAENPINFDPTEILKNICFNRKFLYRGDGAKVVGRLCELGADVSQMVSKDSSFSISEYIRVYSHPKWHQTIIDHQESHLKV